MLAASRWQAVVAAPAPLVPAAAPSYARHAPERTLLYALVQAHYPDFIARVEAEDRPLPEYVREEFDAYLRCGVLEHGFLRVVCEQCHAERLLRFSCKKRGFCPSCGARRMAESARHLVETVLGPHRAHRPQRPHDTPPTAQPTANRHPIRCGPAPAGARSARCRESARNGYGSAPKPALAWPPPTRQTGRKGRLNFLYSVDSFVMLYIAFVIGPQHWSMGLFLAVGTLNYCYKMLAAVALIPLLYLARVAIHAYLGQEQAHHLSEAAAKI